MNRREFSGFMALAPLIAAKGLSAESAAKPYFVMPENAATHDIGHGEASILVGAEQSGGAWWLASVRSDAARKTSLHIHAKGDEYIYVLEGVLSAWIEHKWHDLLANSVVVIPRGVPHALGNRTESSMRYLIAGTPAGFERFFADIEKAARQFPYGTPEFLADLAKIYVKYDSTLISPPPKD